MNEWSTADPALSSKEAPYETSAAMRMHRSGHKTADIMRTLQLRGTKLIGAFQKAIDEESKAARAGRPIHDAIIPKEKS